MKVEATEMKFISKQDPLMNVQWGFDVSCSLSVWISEIPSDRWKYLARATGSEVLGCVRQMANFL